MQKKILTRIFMAIVSVLPFNTYSLGLGDIKIHSVLNQPLNAEIEVKLDDGSGDEMKNLIVQLGSEELFLRAGVERPHILTQLKFTPEIKPDGTAVISVISKDNIRLPFLSFLIDVEWPEGRVVREYTLLIDPPTFVMHSRATTPDVNQAESVVTGAASTGLAAIERSSNGADVLDDISAEDTSVLDENAFAPVIESIDSELGVDEGFDQQTDQIEKTVSSKLLPDIRLSLRKQGETDSDEQIENVANESLDPELEALLAVQTQSEQFGSVVKDIKTIEKKKVNQLREYKIEAGDVMYRIAEKYRSGNVNVHQVMLAIMRHNPKAFINNNVNLVRKGYVIRIPDQDAIQAIAYEEALTEMKRQNALWREYRADLAREDVEPGVDMSYSDRSDSFTEVSELDQEQQEISTPVNESEGFEEAHTQLALVAPQEGEDTIAEPGIDPQARDFQEIERLQRNLALSQEKLEASKLRKQDLESRIEDLQQIVEKSKAIISLKDQQLAQIQLQAEEINEIEAFEGAFTESKKQIEQQRVVTDGRLEQGKRPSGIGGFIFDLLPPSMQVKWGGLLNGPLPWVIILLMVGVPVILVIKRRYDFNKEVSLSIQDDDNDFDKTMVLSPEEMAASRAVDNEYQTQFSEQTQMLPERTQELEKKTENYQPAGVGVVSSELQASSSDRKDDSEIQDDITAEADVYIAYSLFDQGEELLKTAIAEHPHVLTYRVKLLETYFNAGKREAFIEAAKQLSEKIDTKNNSYIWGKTVAMGKKIAPDYELFAQAEVNQQIDASEFLVAKPELADLELDHSEKNYTDLSDTVESGEEISAFEVTDTKIESLMPAEQDLNSDLDASLDEFSLDDISAELNASLDDSSEEVDDDSSGDGELDPEIYFAEDQEEQDIEVDKTQQFESDGEVNSTQLIDEDALDTMLGAAADFSLEENTSEALNTDINFSDLDSDEIGTKLDLAKAYIDMGDLSGAKASLEEVIATGNEAQKAEAEDLIRDIDI